MGKYYITTTLPYVNSDPHVGFALEIIRADLLARYHGLIGDEVFFNTGTDEHGLKIYRKALEEKKDPQEYVDEYAARFGKLREALGLSYNNFIRTTDPNHVEAAKEIWRLCQEAGDIYKKTYRVKYCVGCELEKTESELENGRCPIHPNQEVELLDEENYFFRWSKHQKALLDLYDQNPEFVVPANRLKEIRNFVEGGLEDFSISRLKVKMPWGVEVPGDNEHVMYVWFDALTSYIAAVGWPDDQEKFKKWWPVVQIAGKDNLRQQSAMWQAMLISAGLPTSKQILINGFINSEGQKMSKSLGNVVNPFEYVEKYGTDALRYFLLAKISPFEDGDFSREKFEETYQADLANGLGNLAARVAAMVEKAGLVVEPQEFKISKEVAEKIEEYQYDQALSLIWKQIKLTDGLINEKEVWKLEGEERDIVLTELVNQIRLIGVNLQPFLPNTSGKILEQYGKNIIRKGEALFPRLG